MNILQVNTSDTGGGAEAIAMMLHRKYRRSGHNAWLAVGYKSLPDNHIVHLPPHLAYCDVWVRRWIELTQKIPCIKQARGAGIIRALCEWKERWYQAKAYRLGHEHFHFPATSRLLKTPPTLPELIHCHNLHGNYFDLRMLPCLSRKLPMVLTLHDAWLLSGHCAHSFDCERWKTGCGQCPDLSIPPAIQRDATASNWRKKQAIYAKSRVYVATPSNWLMQKVQQSILAPAVIESRVIPNGIDLAVFHEAENKCAVRKSLNLPKTSRILLFMAHGIQDNPWKDFQTMQRALVLLEKKMTESSLLFVVLGKLPGEAEQHFPMKSKARMVTHQSDPAVIARYYQAADVYIHAAKADTFPTTVVEALACGTPVVATAVGGILEQVEHGQTGFLLPPGDSEAMATAIHQILQNQSLQQAMSEKARQAASCRFDANRMVADYLNWYQEILETYHL